MSARQFLKDQSFDCADEIQAEPAWHKIRAVLTAEQWECLRVGLALAHARGRSKGALCMLANEGMPLPAGAPGG